MEKVIIIKKVGSPGIVILILWGYTSLVIQLH